MYLNILRNIEHYSFTVPENAILNKYPENSLNLPLKNAAILIYFWYTGSKRSTPIFHC